MKDVHLQKLEGNHTGIEPARSPERDMSYFWDSLYHILTCPRKNDYPNLYLEIIIIKLL